MSNHQVSDKEAALIIDLANFSLLFARTERATYHPDGQRPETDSDHTVMLCLVACAFASKHTPHLNLGLISQFALVHDLVEAYAGDTPTLKIDQAGIEDKELRERQALEQISQQFGHTYPWIHQTIEAYERLDTAEARFVKMMDKLMPTLTHILDRGKLLHQFGISLEESNNIFSNSSEKFLNSFGFDQPQIMALRQALRPFVAENCYNQPVRAHTKS